MLTSSAEAGDDGLKYQKPELTDEANSGELCTVAVRYKAPDSDTSEKIEYPLMDNGISNREDFNFVCGIIEASMVIRKSDYIGNATIDTAYQLAKSGAKNDKYREEFCDLLVKLGADK